MPQATVAQVVSELNGEGTGPYTVWGVPSITSGTINGFILDAEALGQGMVGAGPWDSSNAIVQERVRRYETNYAAARLLMSIIGVIATDGFNFDAGGLGIQRFGAMWQTYDLKIRTHLKLAEHYITAMHDWFLVYNQSNTEGSNLFGNPVGYWSVGQR